MRVVNFSYPDDLKINFFPASVMAIGFFDSVHLGHQKVINTAKEIASKKGLKLAAMTFFPHPKEVLSNGQNKVNYLTPLSEKINSLASLGVEICYLVRFNKEFSNLPPKKFVQECIVKQNVKHVVAGFDFSYGRRGEGNMNRLKEDGMGKFEVTTVAKLEEHNHKISSTLIRAKVLEGKVEDIPSFLGDYYKTQGLIEGFQSLKDMLCIKISHKPHFMIPKAGFYHIEIGIEDQNFNGVAHIEIQEYFNIFVKQSVKTVLEDSISIRWISNARDQVDDFIDIIFEKARSV